MEKPLRGLEEALVGGGPGMHKAGESRPEVRRQQKEGIHELGLDEQVGVLWAALQNSRCKGTGRVCCTCSVGLQVASGFTQRRALAGPPPRLDSASLSGRRLLPGPTHRRQAPGRATTCDLCSDSQHVGPWPLSRPVSCLLRHLFLSPPWQSHSNPTAQRLPHRGQGQGQGQGRGPQHSPADRGQKSLRSTGSDLMKATWKACVWGRRWRSLTAASSRETPAQLPTHQ